jgi:threonine/homoserine/homoserine lactone efflux protein
MGEAIGQILPLAIGVALSPIPIIAVVLMLSTPRGRANGPGFLLGWLVGLTFVGTVVLLASGAGGAGDDGSPAAWVGWLKLALGAALLALAVRQWRGRPAHGEEAELPSWMKKIDTFTFGKSVAIGFGLSAVNPKNLLLTVAAAAAIAGLGLSAGDAAISLAVFVILGSLGLGVPIAIFFFMGGRAVAVLEEMRSWMGANNGAIMAVLFLVIGAKLIGDGIASL